MTFTSCINILEEMFLNKDSQGHYKVQVFEQLSDANKWLSNRIMLDPNPKRVTQIQTTVKKELSNPAKQIEANKALQDVSKKITTKSIGKRL